MAQEIYLDGNNKLVVKTNNGRIDANGKQVQIEGDFKCSAETVASLLGIINNEVIKKYERIFHINPYNTSTSFAYVVVKEDNLISSLNEDKKSLTNEIKESEMKNKKLSDYVLELEIVKKQLELELQQEHSKKWYHKLFNK